MYVGGKETRNVRIEGFMHKYVNFTLAAVTFIKLNTILQDSTDLNQIEQLA